MLATVAAVDLMLGDVRLLVDGPACRSRSRGPGGAARVAPRHGGAVRHRCAAPGPVPGMGRRRPRPPSVVARRRRRRASRPSRSRRRHGRDPGVLAHDQEAATRHLDEAVSIFGAHSAGAPLRRGGCGPCCGPPSTATALGPDRSCVARRPASVAPTRPQSCSRKRSRRAVRDGPATPSPCSAGPSGSSMTHPGGPGCCGVPVHQAALTDGWGPPGRRPARRPPRVRERRRTGSWRESVATCCARPGSSSAGVAVTARCRRTWAPVASPAGRWTCCCSVAAGATNTDAATRLHLSARTVEHHVGRLLVKLGAANRTELRAWVDVRP